jgi:putative CocE/NonD family hydrolase
VRSEPASSTADRPASEPRHATRVRYDVRIPTRDGLELSANLWLPVATDEAPDERFPAVLEMIPYRKDDWRLTTDVELGEYLAARGYAFCRLDVRGTGSSEGVAVDEYTEAETQDGHDAVEWLAAQPWSNGNVGMWGISWGGFAAIQVAKLRPPHLRAIVPMYATDDRYLDDVHYVGGCITASEYGQYAVAMVASNALPPRPRYRGDGWRDEWRERLERTPVWLFEWRRQQTDGPYWRRGSLAPDWAVVETPMLLIAGWTDGYTGLLRMMERCVNAPRRLIVGNWSHSFPSDAYPGPRIDWLHELIRFFDRWLKGVDNGADREPAVTWFHNEWAPPEPFPDAWPGSWRAAAAFPAPGTEERIWHLGGDGLLTMEPAPQEAVRDLVHRASAGTRGALSWRAGHPPNGIAGDLRPEEVGTPVFVSAPLPEPLDILGFGEVVLQWESPVQVATVVVRLSDVGPDGVPLQVAIGALNLTHRTSHVEPAPLEPRAVTEVRIPLRAAGHRFRAGHRLRLSIATACWPAIWPSPEPAVHRIHVGGGRPSQLVLPVLPPDALALDPPLFLEPPEERPSIATDVDEPGTWEVVEDRVAGTVTVKTFEGGERSYPDGTTMYISERLAMTASDADPAQARMWNVCHYRLRQDGMTADAYSEGDLRSTATDLVWDVSLRVTLDDEPFFERSWSETIPRNLV